MFPASYNSSWNRTRLARNVCFCVINVFIMDLHAHKLFFLKVLFYFSCSLTVYTLEMALTAPAGSLLMRDKLGYLPHGLLNFPWLLLEDFNTNKQPCLTAYFCGHVHWRDTDIVSSVESIFNMFGKVTVVKISAHIKKELTINKTNYWIWELESLDFSLKLEEKQS